MKKHERSFENLTAKSLRSIRGGVGLPKLEGTDKSAGAVEHGPLTPINKD